MYVKQSKTKERSHSKFSHERTYFQIYFQSEGEEFEPLTQIFIIACITHLKILISGRVKIVA